MSSKALAVKKALRDKLADIPALAGVQITYGHPTKDPERSWIALADVHWTSADWVTTNHRRAESFTVKVFFNVQVNGGTSEDAEDRCFGLAESFETVLMADPGINGLCVTSGYRPIELKSWPIPSAYEAQYEIEVSATCRP